MIETTGNPAFGKRSTPTRPSHAAGPAHAAHAGGNELAFVDIAPAPRIVEIAAGDEALFMQLRRAVERLLRIAHIGLCKLYLVFEFRDLELPFRIAPGIGCLLRCILAAGVSAVRAMRGKRIA